MVAQDGGGLRRACAPRPSPTRHRDADADRHADHRRRLPADRPGQSATGEYTFAIFAVTSIALVLSWFVSVYLRAVPRHAAARRPRPRRRATQPHELFDTPFYRASARTVNWCVRAPLDHDRRDACCVFVLGIVGMGKRAAAVLPGFEPARDHGRPAGSPEGTSFAANEDAAKRVESGCCKEDRRRHRDAPGSAPACRASTCRSTRCSRRRNVVAVRSCCRRT